ncbi:hypothetical protein Bbelb_116430 [Branchiostoma belcheri]|nr:hypothetical protein Bbelb_116430 [Branchiostoma belcheri]
MAMMLVDITSAAFVKVVEQENIYQTEHVLTALGLSQIVMITPVQARLIPGVSNVCTTAVLAFKPTNCRVTEEPAQSCVLGDASSATLEAVDLPTARARVDVLQILVVKTV